MLISIDCSTLCSLNLYETLSFHSSPSHCTGVKSEEPNFSILLSWHNHCSVCFCWRVCAAHWVNLTGQDLKHSLALIHANIWAPTVQRCLFEGGLLICDGSHVHCCLPRSSASSSNVANILIYKCMNMALCSFKSTTEDTGHAVHKFISIRCHADAVQPLSPSRGDCPCTRHRKNLVSIFNPFRIRRVIGCVRAEKA